MGLMEEIEKGAITRKALGRFGFIGELYDARTESFSSRSLFKSSLPPDKIQCRALGRMDYDYKFTDNISDCFDLIEVEGELQIGIICGIITLDGSGKFLTDTKNSEKTVSCSMVCKLETVCQKFYAAWSEILEHVDLKALEDNQNTHVVVECCWGAECLLSVDAFCKSESEKQTVKGCLGAAMKSLGKLITVKGDGKFVKENNKFSEGNDIKIKVNADVIPENGWPTSIEDFYKFMKEVPKLVKNLNEGKGKPLKYVMIPLSMIRKLAKIDCAFDNLVVEIGESFFLSTVFIFEEIAVIKRRFHDHISKMEKYRKYVCADDNQNIKTHLKNFLVKESNLKQIIADDWASVRSGTKQLRDLIKKVEKFKHQLDLIGYESYLQSNQEILSKLSSIKHYISKGIIYLGIGESFADLLAQNPSSEFIVFVTSRETRESELSQNTLNYFITLMENSAPKVKFVIVDLDFKIPFLDNKIKPPKCVYLIGSQKLSLDLYAEYVSDLGKNFAKPKPTSNLQCTARKPVNRVPLEMVCPNFQNSICGSDVLEWTCYKCKSTIEYGFNEMFYCNCGSCHSSSFTFQCKHPKHGNAFVAPVGTFLQDMLSNLRPFKDMNILLLGQSGVGKSTWINSIVNYLHYETLEDAEKGGVICTIPASFTIYDPKTSKKCTINIGKECNRETLEVGNSATQFSHTYSFQWENRLVRLIDTPGLGDTRGIAQDKENILNVINYISNLKELHGVCILLKANENRITGIFSYCLKELLVHLHKNITSNIVFCFTNARSTFYAPGQAFVILQKFIDNLEVKNDLALSHHNMFCLDNEAFLFLCSLTHPKIQYEEHLRASFLESWKISIKETTRLFQSVKNFRPQPLTETLALFEARNRILSLYQTLAEISKTIQLNLAEIEKIQHEVRNSSQKLEELSKKRTFTQITLKSENLTHPRTVCTKPSCVQYIPYRNLDVSKVEYVTHCHEKCYLSTIYLNVVNNSELKGCAAMNNGICKHCGCGWEHHMHINYNQKRVETQETDQFIVNNIMEEESKKNLIENFKDKLTRDMNKYKKEQEVILQVAAKFAVFLKQNAITIYNDSLAAYLEYLIKEEENKPYKSDSEKRLLKSMKDTLARYEEEVRIFENFLGKANQSENLTVSNVSDFEKSLFALELTGETIKGNVNMVRNSHMKTAAYQETPVQISRRDLKSTTRGNKFLDVTNICVNKAKAFLGSKSADLQKNF